MEFHLDDSVLSVNRDAITGQSHSPGISQINISIGPECRSRGMRVGPSCPGSRGGRERVQPACITMTSPVDRRDHGLRDLLTSSMIFLANPSVSRLVPRTITRDIRSFPRKTLVST